MSDEPIQNGFVLTDQILEEMKNFVAIEPKKAQHPVHGANEIAADYLRRQEQDAETAAWLAAHPENP